MKEPKLEIDPKELKKRIRALSTSSESAAKALSKVSLSMYSMKNAFKNLKKQ